MIQLYYVPQTRSTRPRWMLEELGVPYELVRLTRAQTKEPAYLAVHPLGKVPSIVDDGVVLFESAGIVMHLADRFPEKGLAPAPGSAQRGRYYQWILYTMTMLEPLVLQVSQHTRTLPEEKRDARLAAEGLEAWNKALEPLEAALAGEWLLGSFSAADVVMGAVLSWGAALGLVQGKNALAYVQRVRARPAFQRSWHD